MAGMEIRIDSVEGQATPKDTFVSMRVGDYQKQSRFGSAKTYRFPQTEDEHRFARIEVFHRIGHLTVNLDNLSANEPLEVPVDLPEVKLLPMKLAILNDTVDTKTEQKAKQQKAKNKVDAAQKYLSEHHVEEVIADAIREVIHEKPSDPHAFLSEQILKHAAKKKEEMLERDNQVITNDVVDHSAVKLEPPANVQSATAPASKPTVSMLPFRDYYVFHCLPASSNPMENLYGKFAKTEKKSTSEATKPEVVAQTEKTSTSEAKKPEVVAVTQVSSPPEFVPFAKRPSVGTWLTSAPKKKAPGVEAPKEVSVKEAPKVEATAVTTEVTTTEVTPFFKRPSVGTWLMAAPKKSSEEQKAPIASAKPEAVAPAASEPTPKAETQAAKPVRETPPTLPFRDYYATHMSPMPAMESIYAKFPSQPKSAPKAADTEAVKEAPKVQATAVTTEVTTEVTPFAKRPSVGTWLMAAPKKSEEQKAPAAVAKPEAVAAVAETKPATPTPKFQHLPSVATWLCAAPLRKAPAVAPSILDRSRSRIVAMEKEEIVDAVVMEIKQKEQAFQCQIKKKEEEFASELLKKDEEIARLKALLSK